MRSLAVLSSDWPHRLGLRVLPLVSGVAWKSTPKVVDSPSFCSPTPPSFRQPHPFAGSAPVHFQSSKWPVVPRDATATARTRCVRSLDLQQYFSWFSDLLWIFGLRDLACGEDGKNVNHVRMKWIDVMLNDRVYLWMEMFFMQFDGMRKTDMNLVLALP